ncbi:MAG TPA: NUDIX domain-containing protein [Gammaproteobacteria bacterium]|nr:NUDIX domain-containing protein [Gammaproteobacteria bacterium]
MKKKSTWEATLNRSDFECASTQTTHKGHYKVKILTLRHKLFSGEYSAWISREFVLVPNSVAVLLYDPRQDLVVLVEQFRVGAIEATEHGPWLLECVAGYIEKDETPEQAAARETLEEACCKIERLIPITQCYTTPGGCSEMTWIYCGLIDTNITDNVSKPCDEEEDIKKHIIRYEQLMAYKHNLITNSATYIALQWLSIERDKLRDLSYL